MTLVRMMMQHAETLVRPRTTVHVTFGTTQADVSGVDADLERLKALAHAGGNGVDLSVMSDDEIIRRLLKR